jgi:hypothetical protein
MPLSVNIFVTVATSNIWNTIVKLFLNTLYITQEAVLKLNLSLVPLQVNTLLT